MSDRYQLLIQANLQALQLYSWLGFELVTSLEKLRNLFIGSWSTARSIRCCATPIAAHAQIAQLDTYATLYAKGSKARRFLASPSCWTVDGRSSGLTRHSTALQHAPYNRMTFKSHLPACHSFQGCHKGAKSLYKCRCTPVHKQHKRRQFCGSASRFLC